MKCWEVLQALPLNSIEIQRLQQDVRDVVREGEDSLGDVSCPSYFVDSTQLIGGVEITEQHSSKGTSSQLVTIVDAIVAKP